MKLNSLKDLYVNQLRDVYSAEKQLLVALPRMEKHATHPELKQAFTKHLSESKIQVNRLEKIFASLGVSPEGETCKSAMALVAEGEMIMNSNSDQNVIDAGLIGTAQKVEHLEIASYGTLMNYAKWVGEMEAIQLLQASLDEEKATDKRLTIIAETMINRDASSSGNTLSYGKNEGMMDGMSEMMTGSSNSSTLFGLLAGAAVGVLTGILMAPQSGRDSRRRIADSTNNLRNQVEDSIDRLTEAARNALSKAGIGSESDMGGEMETASEGRTSSKRSTAGTATSASGTGTTASGGSSVNPGGTGRAGGSSSGVGGMNTGGTTMPPGV